MCVCVCVCFVYAQHLDILASLPLLDADGRPHAHRQARQLIDPALYCYERDRTGTHTHNTHCI